MRSVTVFLLGVGSMVAAYGVLALAITDESPITAPPWLVPAVVVLAGPAALVGWLVHRTRHST
jgi:cytochrome c-type biogenesis protein CcmH/NrfF